MKRTRVLFLSVSLAVVMLFSGVLLANRSNQDVLFRALGNLAEVIHLVETEYVDELNQVHGGQLTAATDCASCHQPHGSVVNNLLTNAIKFTPEGGRVDLVARRAGLAVALAAVPVRAQDPWEVQDRDRERKIAERLLELLDGFVVFMQMHQDKG